jgi:hypothetical protein
LDATAFSRLDLRTLVGSTTTAADGPAAATGAARTTHYPDDGTRLVPPATAATRAGTGCTTGFSFRDLRRALLACQPIVMDDSSTIATHESWDM